MATSTPSSLPMAAAALALPLRALNHISRVCRDVQRSASFYRQVLGFTDVKRPSSFEFEGAWLFNYGVGIHLIAGEPLCRHTHIDPKSDHLSFQADSLDDVEQRLKTLDIEYVRQVINEGGVRVTQLFFHDPDYNMIEICNCDVLPVVPLEVGCELACPTCMPMQPMDARSDSSMSSDASADSFMATSHTQNTWQELLAQAPTKPGVGLRRSCSLSTLFTARSASAPGLVL